MPCKKAIVIFLTSILTSFVLSFFAPLVVAASLDEDIESIFKRYHLEDLDVSVDIYSFDENRSLYQHQPDRPLNPASVMKLVTTTAAFETLGPDHRYQTEFYSSKAPADGILPDLWVKGYGSPVFVSEELRWIVRAFSEQGIKKIDGPFYVDDSYFGPTNPVRFFGTTGKGLYRVITGALSFNYNHPGSLIAAASSFHNHGTYAQVTSEIEGRSSLLNEKILDPALYTGVAIRNEFFRQGIPITGKILFRRVPPDARLILFHDSQKMSDIIAGLDKFSNNFIAEQILRSLGAARYGNASYEKGLAVLEETLRKIDSHLDDEVLDNGSGLSYKNRIAAAQVTALIQHALHSPYAESFVRALSIAGVDGTLRKRFHGSPLKGTLWAKTGTLYSVSALAGVFLAGEEPIAFAILVNGHKTGPDPIERAQRAILEAVYQHRKQNKEGEKT